MQVVYWRVFWGSTPTEGKGRGEKGWAGVIRAVMQSQWKPLLSLWSILRWDDSSKLYQVGARGLGL